jgi:hypothetical protein
VAETRQKREEPVTLKSLITVINYLGHLESSGEEGIVIMVMKGLMESIGRYKRQPGDEMDTESFCTAMREAKVHGWTRIGDFLKGELDRELINAAEAGKTPKIEELIRLGANIDAPNSDGDTALIRASANGHEAAVEKLLQLSANPLIRNVAGRGAVDVAEENGHGDVVETLNRKMAAHGLKAAMR